MGFRILRQNMLGLVRDALLDKQTADEWARKTGANMGEAVQQVVPTGTIMGTFSARNDPELGWVERHSHNVLSYFPNDRRGMDRYADWTGITEARLLATVTKAAQPESTLDIFGGNIVFEEGLSVPLDAVGLKISDWREITFLGESGGALTQWVVTSPSSEGPGGSDPSGGLEFMEPAPGNLTLEGGSYFGDWCTSPPHVGYSDAEASAMIHSVLDDPAGWASAGITFREVSEESARVRFRVLNEATCTVPELACTHYSGPFPWKAYVELEYAPLHDGIINHESGHAFFYAKHSGTGVMAGGSPDGRPTASDIASLQTWLGNPGEIGAGTFAVGLCQLQAK